MVTQNEGKRNFDQFLQDQSKFLSTRDEKVKTRAEQSVQETVSIQNPQVDSASAKMVEAMDNRKGVDTKERLYNLNKEWDAKKKQKLSDEAAERKKLAEQSFSQGGAKEREQPLVDSLYGDAARRDQELQRKQAEYEKTKGLPKDSKYVNAKMDKYVLKKFNKEFEAVA